MDPPLQYVTRYVAVTVWIHLYCYVTRYVAVTVWIHLYSHFPSEVIKNRLRLLLAQFYAGRVLWRFGQDPLILAADKTSTSTAVNREKEDIFNSSTTHQRESIKTVD